MLNEDSKSDVLDLLLEFMGKEVKMVFWSCPSNCSGYVEWNKDCTDATCMTCGMKRSEEQRLQQKIVDVQDQAK